MSAPTRLDDYDDDLGLPSRPVPRVRPRAPLAEQLPPLQPAVVDDQLAADPAAIPDRPAPRPRVRATAPARGPIMRPDVLALVLAAVVCVCVTVLALKGVDVPDVLQTIGLVAVGVGAGTAIPRPAGAPR